PLIKNAGLVPGIIELYTPEEAKEQAITLRESDNIFPASWQDAVSLLSSGKVTPTKKPEHPIKRVVFYSYKGGVGRTTALIQTAFQLTRAGKRVAIVDMDVEAPGIQALLPRQDCALDEGLIDYLWEKQSCIFDDKQQANINLNGERGIVYSVKDAESNAPIFIVPAGKIGQRYIQRLSVLTTAQLFAQANDPWYQFEQELWDQFQPDIMLIDARTGLNEWGGLSLLRLADDAFIAMYPSKQNAEGVSFIRELLKELGGIEAKLIISPIPEGLIGEELVKNIKPLLGLTKDEQFISIPYHPNIAGSSKFPVETALAYYSPITNNLLEKSSVAEADALITPANRLDLVKSLSFPERDAASILDADFDAIFQKTADFERCLDDAVWVIRGRKGTGKSTLYTLFTQHIENAKKRSLGRLENITVLSAHGESDRFRPTGDVFEKIQQQLKAKQTDWLSFWRAYAVVCLYRSCPEFSEVLKKAKIKPLLSRLENNFNSNEHHTWSSKHTNKLVEFATDTRLNEHCRDALSYFNQTQKLQNQKTWLLYDDLDQDIKESSDWQQDALGGLMRFVYDANNQNLYHIRFKVFLREDIWSNLVFTNKSHFGEARTLLLQWGKADFFRLAYRLSVGGSAEFKTLSNRILPLAENELDEADEETLRQALSPLWGLKKKSKNAYVAQWVYSRLTDASDNTYPRSLTILLKKAQEIELDSKQGKTAPTDHLLRWGSLTKGLTAASKERCDAIKNEYPELDEFFNNINELSSLFNSDDLENLWKETVNEQSFDSFVKRLQQIGFITRKKYSKYDYAIANLYIDGFGIQRKQGQRK
ncbi:MAG: P-loop NTPase, partial [Methyloprofundus sp.]|nr:P-loop NTPase [Methyloprofundus sp.]